MPPPPHPGDDRDASGGDPADEDPAEVDPDDLDPAALDAAVTAALAADDQRTRARAATLERDLARLIEDATLTPPDDEHDPDGATVGFERAQLTHLLRDAQRHLAALEAARSRHAAGTGGICVVCGGPISPARRLARPVAARCVTCAAAGTPSTS